MSHSPQDELAELEFNPPPVISMDVVCGYLDSNCAVFDPEDTADAVASLCSSKRSRRAAWKSPSRPLRPAI